MFGTGGAGGRSLRGGTNFGTLLTGPVGISIEGNGGAGLIEPGAYGTSSGIGGTEGTGLRYFWYKTTESAATPDKISKTRNRRCLFMLLILA